MLLKRLQNLLVCRLEWEQPDPAEPAVIISRAAETLHKRVSMILHTGFLVVFLILLCTHDCLFQMFLSPNDAQKVHLSMFPLNVENVHL